jgi:ERCC4-type nuclease
LRDGYVVVVDKRERNGLIVSKLEELGGSVVFDTIESGDYAISERVGVERKTVTDFERSIIDGRLFDQAARLKENYKLPILIIEGDAEILRLGRKVFMGAVVSLFIDCGIEVIRSYDETETAEILSFIAQREMKDGIREPSPKHGIRSFTQDQFQEQVIGNLPGVGPKLSRHLLSHFGNIKQISNASVKELMEVEKIGKKKATTIHKILNADYPSGADTG